MATQTAQQFAAHKNYYHVLGVHPGASNKEISKAFKKLALRWHPDRHTEYQKSLAHRKFLEIMEAYEVLGHPARKRKYDAYRQHRTSKKPRSRPTYTSTASQKMKKTPPRGATTSNRAATNFSFNANKKFEDDLKRWGKRASRHARNMGKKSYRQFADSVEHMSKLVSQGVFHAIDVISGKVHQKKILHDYQKRLAQAPEDSESHYRLGFLYHQSGELDKAVGCYLNALKLTPNGRGDANILCNLGQIREKQNRFHRAVACYQQAVRLDPGLTIVYAYLGMIHIKMKNFDEAKKCHDHLLSIKRHDLAKQIERTYNT